MAEDNGSNGRKRLDLGDFLGVPDLMMVMEALNYAVARSMFSSGDQKREVSARFSELAQRLADLSPLPKGDRNLGFEWFSIMRKAASCKNYGAYLVKEESYSKERCHLDIVCDGAMERVVANGDEAEIVAAIPEVMRWIREEAPLTAEPLVMFKGLVDIGDYTDDVAKALSGRLASATPFVHLVDAENFWASKNVIETRFAVPASCAEAVIALVAELNRPALEQYSKQYSRTDFSVSPSP